MSAGTSTAPRVSSGWGTSVRALLRGVVGTGAVDEVNGFSKKLHKRVYAETGLSDDGSKRTPVQLFVIRHDERGGRIVSSEYHVTARLALHVESGAFKRPHVLAAGDDGQAAHTVTTSRRSTGASRPSSASTSR